MNLYQELKDLLDGKHTKDANLYLEKNVLPALLGIAEKKDHYLVLSKQEPRTPYANAVCAVYQPGLVEIEVPQYVLDGLLNTTFYKNISSLFDVSLDYNCVIRHK